MADVMAAVDWSRMTLWDFAALRYFGREQAPNERSSMSLAGIPLSVKTAVLLFARIDLLIALKETNG